MKIFLSKFGKPKKWCGLLMALSLGLVILFVMEACGTPTVTNDLAKVKAKYREKVRFSRDTQLEYPDFDLTYLGTGVSTSGGMHVPIKSYYFRVARGKEENIIFWTAGTGVIGPTPFEFDGKDYMIEMKNMTYGQEKIVKLGDDELSISRANY